MTKGSPRERSRSGALIELARIRAGLTQVELARRAHTAQTAISAYEAGAKVPTLETLERILAAMGFDLRMSLTPAEDHDESLSRYLATLPEDVRAKFDRGQRARGTTRRKLPGAHELAPRRA